MINNGNLISALNCLIYNFKMCFLCSACAIKFWMNVYSNKSSIDCIKASIVNMFKNKTDMMKNCWSLDKPMASLTTSGAYRFGW